MRPKPRGGRKATRKAEPGSVDEARTTALEILSRRSTTSRKLKEKLEEKGFTEGAISRVISRFEDLGLLNDLEYARAFIQRRTAGSPRGFFLLKKELLLKGVPKEVADEAIRGAREQTSEVEIAERLVDKKMRSLGKVSEDRARARIFSFLIGRGIPREIAIRVTRRKFFH